MSVNSKMTAIADKIRSLLGLTGTMGMDAMAGNLADANTAVGTQNSLIQQCIAGLTGKASGGGGISIVKVASDFACERSAKTIDITSFPGWESVTAENIFYVTKAVKSTATGSFASGESCSITMSYSNGVISLNRGTLDGSLVLTFTMDVYVAM